MSRRRSNFIIILFSATALYDTQELGTLFQRFFYVLRLFVACAKTQLISCKIWSAICFKIMTRYTCGFFPRILAIIPATRYTCVFLSRILAFFPALWVQTRIYMRTKRPIYMRYKQACGICGHRKSSYRKHRIIPSAKNPFMYDPDER